MPALSTLRYNQALSHLESDNKRAWFQSPLHSDEVVQHTAMSVPMSDISSRQPTTSATSDPVPTDVKYVASGAGPLSSEMKYPEFHAVPHCGASRASYRRTRHGSVGPRGTVSTRTATVDRNLYRVPAAPANLSAGGSLRRKSNDTSRPREMTFDTRHAGLPPSDYRQKHDLSAIGDWTAASESEHRV